MRRLAKLYNKKMLMHYKKELNAVKAFYSNEDVLGSPTNIYSKLYTAIKIVKQYKSLDVRDNQILAALALYDGNVVELDTGEGKSLAICLAAILKASFNKVYIITVSDYLAKRDAEEYAKIYNAMGLSVSFNFREANKLDVYSANVVYSSSSDIIFDYIGQSHYYNTFGLTLDCAILDEIDYILMDNANSTFSVSNSYAIDDTDEEFQFAFALCKGFKGYEGSIDYTEINQSVSAEYDYVFIPALKQVFFTEPGLSKLNSAYGDTIFTADDGLYGLVLDCLSAISCFKKDQDYIVENSKIVLINRDNGCPMVGSEFEYGLHRAIEVKENIVRYTFHSMSDGMSYQMFFSKFKEWSGLSGTVSEVEEELSLLYKKSTVIVPPHVESKRIDLQDKYFVSYEDKLHSIVKDAKKLGYSGVPVLIICESDKELFLIVQRLKKYPKLSYVSASNYLSLSTLIEKTGTCGNITVSTSLLSRGVDIKTSNGINTVGGLAVLLTSRFGNRRIIRQIKGRTARQGNSGVSQCYISLEDSFWSNLSTNESHLLNALKSNVKLSSDDKHLIKELIKKLDNRLHIRCVDLRVNLYKFELLQDTYRDKFFSVSTDLKNTKISLKERILSLVDILKVKFNQDEVEIKLYIEMTSAINTKLSRFGYDITERLINEIALRLIIEYYGRFRAIAAKEIRNYMLASLLLKTESDLIMGFEKEFKAAFADLVFEILDMFFRAEMRSNVDIT